MPFCFNFNVEARKSVTVLDGCAREIDFHAVGEMEFTAGCVTFDDVFTWCLRINNDMSHQSTTMFLHFQ